MMMSNNERIGKTLEILNGGLRPFVMQQLQATYGPRAVEIARSTLNRNEERKQVGSEYGNWDTHSLLVLMWGTWNEVFRNSLGFAERNLVSEIRDVRNKWAHQGSFSTDDTYRALDSITRLLARVAPDQAAEVDVHRKEVLHLRFEEVRGERPSQLNLQSESRPTQLRPNPLRKQADTISGTRYASDLLDSGESAIVLFTRRAPGTSADSTFLLRADGSGHSGNWKRIGTYEADKVIIYYRPEGREASYGEIYLADFDDVVPSSEEGRSIVKFRNARKVGTTGQTWPDFSGKGQSPAGRITKK